MILLDSRILGFGKLRDIAFDFREGINLVFAANEGGKSTLQRFLVGLLYGQLRSDLRMQRRLDSWVERYKPWYGQEYGGMLRLRLADGREMEVRRSFGRDENRIEIRTSTGEDITRRYEQQRNGEVLFAKYHCGLPKELFESVGIIRENGASEIHGRETIRDRIANLAHSGDEELSVRQSLSRLEEALDAIGSDRAPTKLFKQTMDLVQSLESERKACQERRIQFQGWLDEKKSVAGEVRSSDRDLSAVKAMLLYARRRDVAARIESLEDIDREISAFRVKIESLGAREDFPVDLLEELNQLVGARDSIVRRLEEVRSNKEESLSELAGAEAERRELAVYAPLAESGEAEKITEWFVSYLSMSLQKDGLKKTVDRLRGEADTLEKRLKKLAPALKDAEKDWQSFAREAAEDEQNASRRCAGLSEKILQEKAKQAEAAQAAFNRKLGAVLLFLLAAVPFGLRALVELEGIWEWVAYGSGIGCLVFSIVMWLIAGKSGAAGRETERGIRALDLEQDGIREAGEVKRKELAEVVAKSGFQGLEDFLAAARRTEQDRMKLAELNSRLEEAGLESRRHQVQSDETYRLLKDSLAKVGLSCSPGNLKFQIDLVRTSLRRYRDLDARYNRCLERTDSLKEEVAALDQEYENTFFRIRAMLDRAGVDTPESFREECSKRQKAAELLEKTASRDREFRRLADGRTLEQWKEALSDMDVEQGAGTSEANVPVGLQDPADSSDMPFLPYLPTIPELEEKERSLASMISDARERYARAVERVNHAFQNYRAPSEIDEDLAVAAMKFSELERNRAALSIAVDAIDELSRQQQEVLAPQLNAAVEQRFLRLCGRRYAEVKIDPDFQVWVRESGSGELRLAEFLSRGTQDQLYFAIRFGILDLLSDESESCPCLLDEPFAAYDRPRMHEAYGVLVEESARRQLILFTCREDLLDIARQRNANIIELNS